LALKFACAKPVTFALSSDEPCMNLLSVSRQRPDRGQAVNTTTLGSASMNNKPPAALRSRATTHVRYMTG
jgi:hypothetical protein